MRIRSRLFVLVLAVLVPAIGASAIALAYVFRDQQQLSRQGIQETARALALVLDAEMARRETLLRTLSRSLALEEGDLARFHRHAAAVAADLDAAIILSDLEGRQLANTRLAFGTQLPPMLPQERQMRAQFGNEAMLVSNLYLPPAGLGPHSFAVQIPVVRDGRVTSFLTIASFARELQPLLSSRLLPTGWQATIVDRDGRIAARSVNEARFVGEQVRPRLRDRLREESEGLQQGTTLGGVDGTAFFSRAPLSGWTLIVSVADDTLRGSALRTVLALSVVALLLFASGLALAWRVARRIALPIDATRGLAERLPHNETVLLAPSGIVEIDAVQRALLESGDQLRRAHEELERRVADALAGYERSQQALVQSQKLEALGRLTGGIAHDFNNVLQTLMAGLQAVRVGANPQQLELLDRCRRAVARGSDVARQLMAFGRVQSVRARTVNPAVQIRESAPLLQGSLPSSIQLALELDDSVWPVHVDPAQLELALLNLVINARDAMPGGGRIVVAVRNATPGAAAGELPPGDYVAVSVADNGIGMTDDVRSRAIDPFFTTKATGEGFGMGLPQAYGFARQSGGTLALQSEVGRGTTATLFLPKSAEEETSAEGVSTETSRQGHGRVLLVEDDPLVRDTVAAGLRGDGFAVESAASADEALARLERGERYDAVLTDVVMPGSIDGLQLARILIANHPEVGVVVATGYTDRGSAPPRARALSKPYEVAQAAAALLDAIAQARRTRS